MKTRLVALALSTWIATNALAAPSQYLCITDQAAGLHYDRQTGAWIPQAFSNRPKYILRHLTDDDWKGEYRSILKDQTPQPTWGFFAIGGEFTDQPQATCYESYTFFCRPFVATLEFEKDSLRFQVTYSGAYISQGYWQHVQSTDPEGYQLQKPRGLDPISQPDDVMVEIGTCSPF
jgi:hypothetical protein